MILIREGLEYTPTLYEKSTHGHTHTHTNTHTHTHTHTQTNKEINWKKAKKERTQEKNALQIDLANVPVDQGN